MNTQAHTHRRAKLHDCIRHVMQRIPEKVKEPIRNILGKEHPYGLSATERSKLRRLPRFQQSIVQLFGRNITIVDSASFLASHQEIFVDQIYRIPNNIQQPVIIDAGANTGLARVYFKRSYPGSHIIAIESDPIIYSTLVNNLNEFGASNVQTLQGAVWDSTEELCFAQDHADAGRVSNAGSTIVKGVRLRNLLIGKTINLLKIDIEGAETRVIHDCDGALDGVERLFVEYHSFANERQSLSDLLGVLERSKFHYYIQRTGVHSSFPLLSLEHEAGFDLQLNIFAIREDLL